MSLRIDGKDPSVRLIRQPSGDEASQDEFGVWRATATFKCAWSRVFDLMPRRYQTKHPDFSNLVCDSVTFSRVEGDLALIKAVYAGGNNSLGDGSGNGENEPVIEVDNFVTQVPIETHPDFEDVIAGTPDAPINKALFPDGVFTGFETYLDDGSRNIMAGVTTFDAYVQVVRRTTIQKTRPTNTDVGMIDAPPVTNSDFEYVKTRASYQRVGSVYVFSEEWTSGPKDADINYYIY